jgi:Ni,Fe-hydrogenase III large subunit
MLNLLLETSLPKNNGNVYAHFCVRIREGRESITMVIEATDILQPGAITATMSKLSFAKSVTTTAYVERWAARSFMSSLQ